MTNIDVTLVVVPRERFSYTRQSLESIYQYTKIPFNLIYIDGKSPIKTANYLQEQSQKKGFQLIRMETYLSPNEARNIGLSHVQTKYLVFMDNDVIVSEGWLSQLVQCAETTEASVVGPLMCQDEPVHKTVHFAGGESHIYVDTKGRRRLREKMYLQGKKVEQVLPKLRRCPIELAEFHCVLVRRNIFDKIGYLDENFFNTKEHLDFCMTVTEAGGLIYFEPSSLVTYVPDTGLESSDIPFYMLRWSDDWTIKSLKRMQQKWQLTEDEYFKTKYRKLGWRRRERLLCPLTRRLLFGQDNRYLTAILARFEKLLNRYLTYRYSSQKSKVNPQKLLTLAGS